MKDKRNDELPQNDGRLIAGFLGAVLLTIPIIIRLAYGDGTTWDWIFLVVGAALATYWIVLAFRGRRIRQEELANLKRG